jgi:hypothetical protein
MSFTIKNHDDDESIDEEREKGDDTQQVIDAMSVSSSSHCPSFAGSKMFEKKNSTDM